MTLIQFYIFEVVTALDLIKNEKRNLNTTMIKKISICLLFLSLIACNNNKKQEDAKAIAKDSSATVTKVPDTLHSQEKAYADDYYNFNNTVLHTTFKDSIYARFSDNDADDLFTVEIPAGNINDTKVVLKIFSKAGALLFEDSFETNGLISDDTQDIKNDTEMEAYVLVRAKEILKKDSFEGIDDLKKLAAEGSILSQSKEEFENYPVFVECQKEKRRLFYFLAGYEDLRYLGYSKKLGKAVVVISCC